MIIMRFLHRTPSRTGFLSVFELRKRSDIVHSDAWRMKQDCQTFSPEACVSWPPSGARPYTKSRDNPDHASLWSALTVKKGMALLYGDTWWLDITEETSVICMIYFTALLLHRSALNRKHFAPTLHGLNNVLCLAPDSSESLQVIFDLCWRLYRILR